MYSLKDRGVKRKNHSTTVTEATKKPSSFLFSVVFSVTLCLCGDPALLLEFPFRRKICCMVPQDLLDILVCPVCKKPLVQKENGESLKCGECRRVYPVRDNIPILLVDEAATDPS